jgi:hypothetical protein
MTRSTTIVTLAVLSSILTPVVVMATDTNQGRPAAQQAKAEAATTTKPQSAEAPACARRVKVVYAGYGEAHAAACAVTAEMRR